MDVLSDHRTPNRLSYFILSVWWQGESGVCVCGEYACVCLFVYVMSMHVCRVPRWVFLIASFHYSFWFVKRPVCACFASAREIEREEKREGYSRN